MTQFNEENYRSFSAKDYISRFVDPRKDPLGVHPQFLECFHNFYAKYHQNWDTKTAHLLEYGGGPTLYCLVPACPFVEDITFAEYVEANRAEVELWKNNDKEGHNWTPYIDYCITTLDGCSEPNAVENREAELRRKIREVVHCDLRSDDQILVGASHSKYDIIQANGCVECCSNDILEFQAGFKKLANLLKPNGYLVSMTSLGSKWWSSTPGGPKLSILTLEANDVDTAIEKADLKIVETRSVSMKQAASLTTTQGIRFVVAQKTC